MTVRRATLDARRVGARRGVASSPGATLPERDPVAGPPPPSRAPSGSVALMRIAVAPVSDVIGRAPVGGAAPHVEASVAARATETASLATPVPGVAELVPASALVPGDARDPMPPPGRAPAGDARSMRWRDADGRDWFALIYRDGATLVVREGRVGCRGEWTAVVYPRAAAAALAYANRCARARAHGFVDV